jgi:hypothetical protein
VLFHEATPVQHRQEFPASVTMLRRRHHRAKQALSWHLTQDQPARHDLAARDAITAEVKISAVAVIASPAASKMYGLPGW